jgi:hypothetical protein
LYNQKFGKSDGITTTEETVWDGATLYAGWLAAAETISILSASDLDDGLGSTGTGALTVQIYGLDANWDEINETVTLDGDTGSGATTVNEYLRVNRIVVEGVGSGNTNAGDLTATADTGGNTMAIVQAGYGQTLMALWTVPRGYTGYMFSLGASVGKGDDAEFLLFARQSTGGWNLKHSMQVYQSNNEAIFMPPLKFAEKTDLDVRVIAGVGSVASADFSIVYIQNPVAQ